MARVSEMAASFVFGDPPIEVVLRPHARARRFSLRVSQRTGVVSLSLPPWAPEQEAWRFVQAQEAWIRKAQAALPPAPSGVALGGTVLFRGRPYRLETAKVRGVALQDDCIVLPEGRQAPVRRLETFFKHSARLDLMAACTRHAARLGRPFGRVTLRDPVSRWGSCTSGGHLMFSWRLIMAPPKVLDYVAAHEVAHLAQMNHAPVFWAEVARLMPGYAEPRAWLRSHGHSLHQFQFNNIGSQQDAET